MPFFLGCEESFSRCDDVACVFMRDDKVDYPTIKKKKKKKKKKNGLVRR
jgi:hypothetical protein